ncbi:ASCH domain-containing protein [Ciceribacter ferrooxidans]|uniref:ASCH domain-containing protein n=1 Tax=Ciceribacter ferrooxidans TaxID=2509717 RepID=A0A4Q2SZS3_9HYPH|nr:ASCH domain-containing protein [Ciceribacter ferrooxidans]RYC10134.1 ASCH domain-containing protein [Ciceribacter ferrooxidans]
MDDLPKLALSIRQPWAWAILHAGKPVENRSWSTNLRGPICIHAAKGMTMAEYAETRQFVWSLGIKDIPAFDAIRRGGIIGVADLVDVVTHHPSPWFFGPYGFVLANPRAVPFISVKGALGLFDWRKNLEISPC